jgi:hypothetical protein
MDAVQEYLDELNKSIRSLYMASEYMHEWAKENPLYKFVQAFVPKSKLELEKKYYDLCWGITDVSIKYHRACKLAQGGTSYRSVSKRKIIAKEYRGDKYDYLRDKVNAKKESKYLKNIWIFGGENEIPYENIEEIIKKFNAIYQHLG